MPSVYPQQVDVFSEPSAPANTPLDSSGTGDRNHWQHHRDLGDAVEALQVYAAKAVHTHNGSDGTSKLAQANTHQDADTDSAPTAIHHTLGTGANQAARGNHQHQAADILNLGFRTCTSTTRPTSPILGLTIHETDTARFRCWTKLPWESTARWVLLPMGSIPVVRLLQGTRQRIPGQGASVEFRTEEEDTFGNFNTANSLTEVTISEPGLYEVSCSVSWDPSEIFGDHAQVGLVINGELTKRIASQFIRGNFFTPGFSQVLDLPACNVRLKAGDTVSIRAWHNGAFSQWTFINTTKTTQGRDTRLDVIYKGV